MALLRSDEMIQALIPYDEALRDRMMIGRVVREVGRFALARVDAASNTLQVHRLVQSVIRARMSEEEQEQACHEVHRVLVGARPRAGDTDDPENWPRYDQIWAHLGPSRARLCAEGETLQLLIDRVRYLWKRGELGAALAFAEELSAVWISRGRAPDDGPGLAVAAVPHGERALVDGPVRGSARDQCGGPAGPVRRTRQRSSPHSDDCRRLGSGTARTRAVRRGVGAG